MPVDPKATLLLCKWLRDRIKVWETQAKAELGMRPGERLAGEIGSSHLGFVTLARGKRSTRVDEDAFTEWVAQRWPTEIVQSVRPAFRAKLLSQALDRGAVIDDDGVVCEAVTVGSGEPYPTTQLDEQADTTVAELLAKGALGIDGLKAIEP